MTNPSNSVPKVNMNCIFGLFYTLRYALTRQLPGLTSCVAVITADRTLLRKQAAEGSETGNRDGGRLQSDPLLSHYQADSNYPSHTR